MRLNPFAKKVVGRRELIREFGIALPSLPAFTDGPVLLYKLFTFTFALRLL